ncbi:MAG: retropepsin-like aspartic protease [Chloroflexota bacterium]
MLVYSYDYDLSYDPAAPQLSILLRAPGTNNEGIQLNAMVDTGADATIVPKDILEELGLEQSDSLYIRGVTGHRTQVAVYDVTIEIGPFTFSAVPVVATPLGSEPLIGRDILNNFSITLNGPAQVVELSE